jgi:hypothetical protein
MTDFATLERALLDELEKISASKATLGHKSRAIRRPMSAATLLRKEKEGTLYKATAGLGGGPSAGPLETTPVSDER